MLRKIEGRRRKGQTFFSTLLCLSQYNNEDVFLLNKNLLTNLVILRLYIVGVGLVRPFYCSNLVNLRCMLWGWVW